MMAVSIVGLLVLALIGLGLLAAVVLVIRTVAAGNPNRVPCPKCGKMIMTPVEQCPKCGGSLT
jgi:rRNA maturation endonuclease Nob1